METEKQEKVKVHEAELDAINEEHREVLAKKTGRNYADKNIYINAIKTSIVSDKNNNWHKFEIINPKLFAGMYQFWTQKL